MTELRDVWTITDAEHVRNLSHIFQGIKPRQPDRYRDRRPESRTGGTRSRTGAPSWLRTGVPTLADFSSTFNAFRLGDCVRLPGLRNCDLTKSINPRQKKPLLARREMMGRRCTLRSFQLNICL